MVSVKSVKAVRFSYESTPETRELLEMFRMMVNHAIRICLEENIQGRLKLRNRIRTEFMRRYGVVSCYGYSVAEVAWSIVKKHRKWRRMPVANRLMFKMDVASYSLNYGLLNLPNMKGHRVLVPLKYGGLAAFVPNGHDPQEGFGDDDRFHNRHRFEYVNASRTSQTCHVCGFVNRKLKLNEREWPCPNCRVLLDRDLNAAINIERRGKIPCLGGVRPGARGTDEAVKGNETQTPILRAETPKGGR